MTRAKRELFITFTESDERQSTAFPSSFLGANHSDLNLAALAALAPLPTNNAACVCEEEIKSECCAEIESAAIHVEFNASGLSPCWPAPPASESLPPLPTPTTTSPTRGDGASPKKRLIDDVEEKADKANKKGRQREKKKARQPQATKKQQQPKVEEQGKPPLKGRQSSLLAFFKPTP
jgi:hypothetical protein